MEAQHQMEFARRQPIAFLVGARFLDRPLRQ
jgi:hypothetical protein